MSQDIVKIWMVNFGEPLVIRQIHHGFPLPKICAIYYDHIATHAMLFKLKIALFFSSLVV